MTVEMAITTNLRTGKRRVYIDGVRVSEAKFNEYDGIGCFFTRSTTTHLRHWHVGVKKWWAP